MKTFQEFVIERDRLLAEADESKHLRAVLISNMGLEDTINDKTGEDIPLEQLDLDVITKRLKGSALWKKISTKVQKHTDEILREPQNKRLAELLDVLTSEPLNIGKIMGHDDEATPQKTPTPGPNPDQMPPSV